MAQVYKSTARTVARLPGVRRAVRAEAEAGGERARALLAEHRRTGASSIEVTHHRLDTLVELVDPLDAVAIEYGHGPFVRDDGVEIGPMEGLYIIHRAFPEVGRG